MFAAEMNILCNQRIDWYLTESVYSGNYGWRMNTQ